jgi:hypothetical protein
MINKKQRSHVADHKGGDVRIISLEQHGQHASPLHTTSPSCNISINDIACEQHMHLIKQVVGGQEMRVAPGC